MTAVPALVFAERAALPQPREQHLTVRRALAEARRKGLDPLLAIRSWRRMTYAQLSAETAIPVGVIMCIENGMRGMLLSEAEVIAKALRVPVDMVVEGRPVGQIIPLRAAPPDKARTTGATSTVQPSAGHVFGLDRRIVSGLVGYARRCIGGLQLLWQQRQTTSDLLVSCLAARKVWAGLLGRSHFGAGTIASPAPRKLAPSHRPSRKLQHAM